jgi:hypothetical protein
VNYNFCNIFAIFFLFASIEIIMRDVKEISCTSLLSFIYQDIKIKLGSVIIIARCYFNYDMLAHSLNSLIFK